MRSLSSSFRAFTFGHSFFLIVCLITVNFPVRVFPQICVKPRNVNVSGLPSPRSSRRSAAYRPNSIKRVFSGCSSSPNFRNLSFRSFKTAQHQICAGIPQWYHQQNAPQLHRHARAFVSIVEPTGRRRSASTRWKAAAMRLPPAVLPLRHTSPTHPQARQRSTTFG